jgi:hypothetical protein
MKDRLVRLPLRRSLQHMQKEIKHWKSKKGREGSHEIQDE